MSYFRKSVTLLFVIIAGGLVTRVSAQVLFVHIEVVPGASSRVLVEASGPPSSKWSFPDSYAGVLGLASRVEKFQLLDSRGREIPFRKLAPGQFASDEPASKFKYEVQIAAPARSSDAALVSWLDAERAVLLFGDLLPVLNDSRANEKSHVSGRLILPPGWTAYSTDLQGDEIEIADPDRAVIVLGKTLRSSARPLMNRQFTLVNDGEWAFSDAEALDLATKVFQLHAKVGGGIACKKVELALLPFPQNVAANKWSAQARGCTVTLLMGKLPSKVGALSQLGLALTHELFHLWIPNGLALGGDYDWFYEGFTMYQAARAAVRLDLLTFPQFLNAIGDAYNGSSSPGLETLSLIEATKRRWTTGGSAVYSKAMVVAFLYDLNLRSQSKGKRSLDDVYRRIFGENVRQLSSTATEADGNTIVTSALRAESPRADFVDHFIAAPVTIDLQKDLAPFGLTVETLGLRTHVFVSEHLTGRQRDLLKQLGYNEPRRR